MGGLVGGAGGYGISELLKKNPGMYDWIKDNPELATMLGFLGADALRGGGGGSSDIPSYQPYSPLTYESLGGYAPSTEMPQMAQGGIAGGGSSGLNGLRTGLRDAIVNSIDDPNRQGVNSFVPSMLKAYDEIPKLQAGGISGGANPGFVDPGKQAVQQQQSQPGYAQSKTGDYGQSGYGQMSYGTDPYRQGEPGYLQRIGSGFKKYGTGLGLFRQLTDNTPTPMPRQRIRSHDFRDRTEYP